MKRETDIPYTRILEECSEQLGGEKNLVYGRIYRGWEPEKACFTPPRPQRRAVTVAGITKHLYEWLDIYDISRQGYYRRVQAGMTPEEALTTPKMKRGRPRGRRRP